MSHNLHQTSWKNSPDESPDVSHWRLLAHVPPASKIGGGDSPSPDAPAGGSIDDGSGVCVWGGSDHVRQRKADHDTTTYRRLGGKGSSAAMIYLRGSFFGPRHVCVASLEMTRSGVSVERRAVQSTAILRTRRRRCPCWHQGVLHERVFKDDGSANGDGLRDERVATDS
jgi:hypothetical protein